MRSMKLLAAGAALAVPAGLLGIAVPAGASSGPTVKFTVVQARGAHLPKVKIKGHVPIYSPTALTVPSDPDGTCQTTFSFSVKNNERTSQTMNTSSGDFVTLTPKSTVFICIYGGSGGQITFGLDSNGAASLTVTVS